MKYEIIRDKDDLLVLSVNTIVIVISRDMSVISSAMQDDYEERMKNGKVVYVPAILDVELPIKEDKNTEMPVNEDKLPSLGKLFEL